MRVVLVDTGAFLALVDSKDAFHSEALRVSTVLASEGAALFTTNLLVAETYTIILRKLGGGTARRWISNYDLPVVRVTAEDERRAVEIIRTPAGPNSEHFHPYSYFDATSFAVMERLDIKDAFGFDRHFQLRGFNLVTTF